MQWGARDAALDVWDPPLHQPVRSAAGEALPASSYVACPASSYTTALLASGASKARASVNAVVWTQDGRHLIAGSNLGDFMLWNGEPPRSGVPRLQPCPRALTGRCLCCHVGTTFAYETSMTAHEAPIRAMQWTHDGSWLISGDESGCIKYFKNTLNNVKDIRSAHNEAARHNPTHTPAPTTTPLWPRGVGADPSPDDRQVRGLACAPTDLKFCSGSDDATIKIWDFGTGVAEATFAGHGGNVRAVDWHPFKARPLRP